MAILGSRLAADAQLAGCGPIRMDARRRSGLCHGLAEAVIGIPPMSQYIVGRATARPCPAPAFDERWLILARV